MAKYRKASEKTIARGKGKSTDELSLADAKSISKDALKKLGLSDSVGRVTFMT